MRSALLALLTVLVLAGVFALYAYLQPKTTATTAARQFNFPPTTTAAPTPEDPTRNPSFRAGDNPWVQEFSETTGQLRSQFRATKYEPTPNHGPVNVTL